MSAAANKPGAQADDATPLFCPFEWVPSRLQQGGYELLSDVRDIAAGVAVSLQMVHRTQMNLENGEAPLLAPYELEAITRMGIGSMRLIHTHIDSLFQRMTHDDRKEGSA